MEINYDFIITKLQGMLKLMDKDRKTSITIKEVLNSFNYSKDDKISSNFEEIDIDKLDNNV